MEYLNVKVTLGKNENSRLRDDKTRTRTKRTARLERKTSAKLAIERLGFLPSLIGILVDKVVSSRILIV